MIKLDILNLIFIVKKLKLCCTLTAVLVSRHPQLREAHSSGASNTDATLHLREELSQRHSDVISTFCKLESFQANRRKNHFLPPVSDALGISSNENKISLRNVKRI